MNKQQLIIQRNKLFLLLLWACYIMDIAVLFLFSNDRYFLYWCAFSIPLLCMTFFINKIKNPVPMMYVLMGMIYAYIIMLNETYPSYVNFVFFLFPLLLSMVFQDKLILILSAAVTCGLQIFYFITKFDRMSASFEKIDLFYYLLFTLMTVILLIFYLRFINRLWKTAIEQKEEVVEALQSAKAHFNLVFRQSQDAIALIDVEKRVLAVNPAFETLYGWKSHTLEKKQYPLAEHENESSHQFSGKMVTRTDYTVHGTPLDVEVRVSPIYDNRGTLIAYSEMIRDVTKKLEQEQFLFQAEKLRVAGEMAAGVAHEIRNPLTVLQGFVQIMQEKNPEDKVYTSLMLSELKRVNDIVSEFLVLAKPQALHHAVFSLNKVLEETLQLFTSESLLKNISLEYIESDEELLIFGDRNQMKQVLINLFKNSCDAIKEKGSICISASLHLSEKIVLTITDTGSGMSAETIKKIRSPFFTTKEKGTGLGLVITEKIINQHKGMMEIESTEGEGTTVTITMTQHKE